MKWALLLLWWATNLSANAINYSSYPFAPTTKMINVAVGAHAGQLATQISYTYKLNEQFTFDAEIGITNGLSENALLFAGAEYEIIPDYLRQPRVAARLFYENINEASGRIHLIAVHPTISKGLNVAGKEIFPYLAIPIRVAFTQSSYLAQWAMSAGVSTALPFEQFKHLIVSSEATLGLYNHSSSLYLALSFPFKESLIFRNL